MAAWTTKTIWQFKGTFYSHGGQSPDGNICGAFAAVSWYHHGGLRRTNLALYFSILQLVDNCLCQARWRLHNVFSHSQKHWQQQTKKWRAGIFQRKCRTNLKGQVAVKAYTQWQLLSQVVAFRLVRHVASFCTVRAEHTCLCQQRRACLHVK